MIMFGFVLSCLIVLRPFAFQLPFSIVPGYLLFKMCLITIRTLNLNCSSKTIKCFILPSLEMMTQRWEHHFCKGQRTILVICKRSPLYFQCLHHDILTQSHLNKTIILTIHSDMNHKNLKTLLIEL